MGFLVWAAVLLLIGGAMIVLEVFVPSGGILGFFAALAIVASIALAFQSGPFYGLGFLLTALIGAPVVISLALRWWPHTPMGRRLLLQGPAAEEVLPDNPELAALRQLLGRIGVAKSPMLPAGAVLIDGRVVNAQSEGLPIDQGERVRVVEVRGNRVVVRALGPDEPPVAADAAASEDPLERPIDVVGVDPFEEQSS